MNASSRPVIVIPGDDPMHIAESPMLDLLRERGEVRLYQDRPMTDEEKLKRTADATVIINSRSSIHWRENVLRQLPNLKMISLCGIGTDGVDLTVARELGIVVSNIPGRTAGVVSEHAFALMFAAARHLAYQTAEVKAGRWTPRQNIFLLNKTLGIVGTGAIGIAMIRLARAVGMNVIAWSYHPKEALAEELGFRYVELDELLASSDVVSLHVKLTPDSRHLIGTREFALMKPGALLVNTARGAVVDTDAMVAALNSGHLGGAGLDVYDVEPVPADHPLLKCDQVVLAPHNADQTPEGNNFLNEGAIENVLAFLDGKTQNNVA